MVFWASCEPVLKPKCVQNGIPNIVLPFLEGVPRQEKFRVYPWSGRAS